MNFAPKRSYFFRFSGMVPIGNIINAIVLVVFVIAVPGFSQELVQRFSNEQESEKFFGAAPMSLEDAFYGDSSDFRGEQTDLGEEELYYISEGFRKKPRARFSKPINFLEKSLSNSQHRESHSAATVYVRTIYYNWFDRTRGRVVPVKIYAPISTGNAFPVIVFSHGLGGSRERCSYLGEHWAANGYVSVHIQHYGSDETVWKGKLRPLNELRNAYNAHWTGRTRVQDMIFVLEQLRRIVEEKNNPISSDVDLNRIGVAGYDLGAYASLLMVGMLAPEGHPPLYLPQIKAVLAMGPPVQPNRVGSTAVYSQIETPCLFITGTRDDGIIGFTKAYQRRVPYDHIDCNDQYLVVLHGTDHQLYGGHLFTGPSGNDAPFYGAISRISTQFWNAYLKEDPHALQFMMSRDSSSMIAGVGRMEKKFYMREEMQREQYAGSTPFPSRPLQETPFPGSSFAAPNPRYDTTDLSPRPLRNRGESHPPDNNMPRRLPH